MSRGLDIKYMPRYKSLSLRFQAKLRPLSSCLCSVRSTPNSFPIKLRAKLKKRDNFTFKFATKSTPSS